MSDVYEKPIFFTLYENLFDNRVLEMNRFDDVPWEYLVKTIKKEHQLVPNKTDVKLLAPVRFVDLKDPGCHYALYTENEEKKGFGKEGEVKHDRDGNPYVWRGAINVDSWSMLPVDIDGEQTIAEAEEFFQEYTYVAYTSFNHLADGQTEKFRLLLPLKEPVSHKDFTTRVPAIQEWLGDADLSSTAGARGFYLPSCPSERKDKARRWDNEGKQCLDLLSFDVDTREKAKPHIYHNYIPNEGISDDMKQVLIDQLKNTYLGNYEEWWKVSSAMVNAEFTLEDFKYVTINGMMNQKSELDCEHQWNKALSRHHRGTSINPGYLYNLVGGLKGLKKIKLEREIEELERLVGDES